MRRRRGGALSSLARTLLTGGTSNYVVQTAQVSLNMPALYASLTPAGQQFVELVTGDPDTVCDLAALLKSDWSERPELLDAFTSLPSDSRVEALAYCTVPVHEYQHHVDLVQTPFGAYLHVLATKEYIAFQKFADILVLHTPRIPPGKLLNFGDWLRSQNLDMTDDAWQRWEWLRAHLDLMEVWGDFDHVETADVAATYDTDGSGVILGLTFTPVTVNGWYHTFTIAGWEPWYVAPATVLEGRAVIASLIWSLRQTRATQDRSLIAAFLEGTYGNAPHDYRLCIDLAARLAGFERMEHALAADGRTAA